jgi:7SK snRNA methylphosphate capping enzyme
MKHKPAHIVGIDIDPNLIHSARTHLKLAYSLHNPDSDEVDLDIGFRYHYFPLSMSTMFNFMPILPAKSTPHGFPYNVEFKANDWLKIETEKEKYDTILA